ncbi:hypothetical protein MHUMG1_09863 [Metarhizium humberi]|uniref:Peptidase S1 domain-containing protein n=1 Tax=Metarhizium humberi TaxID=2596975 RepID=A0A9P8M2N4_9HYPO|nr:hypothetical protein MHUMG1_09863 [Metarhizium humberi]
MAVAAVIAMLAAQTATALPLSGEGPTVKIVNGQPAAPGKYPYIVALLPREGAPNFCGGTIINQNTVLTAAHCCQGMPQNAVVRAGSYNRLSGGKVSRVVSQSIHPQFTPEPLDNDVCILKISPDIQESQSIKYAKLPQQGSDLEDGTPVMVAGWGNLQQGGQSPDDLREVALTTVGRAQCQNMIRQQVPQAQPITQNVVCAGAQAKDACNGDSGGPLVQGDTLVGVVSYGYGCARQGVPGVYARVGNKVDFIQGQGTQSPGDGGGDVDDSGDTPPQGPGGQPRPPPPTVPTGPGGQPPFLGPGSPPLYPPPPTLPTGPSGGQPPFTGPGSPPLYPPPPTLPTGPSGGQPPFTGGNVPPILSPGLEGVSPFLPPAPNGFLDGAEEVTVTPALVSEIA